MELTYHWEGDYLIPDISLGDGSSYNIGKYGRMRQKYLCENYPSEYLHLVITEKLWKQLEDLEEECHEMLDRLMEQMAKREGLTEHMKSTDQLGWIRKMNWTIVQYRSVIDDSRIIINLASKEYSKCIEKYLTSQDRYITIVFCELSGDKLVTKGTYAKMARGEMVRFIAENNIENPVEIQKFDRLGYSFRYDLSSDSEYVFERKIK